MNLPRKWTEVYPQGTVTGNEEQKFFIALARHSKYSWRSVPALSKASGLTQQRVEEIIQKYHPQGIVVQSAKNETNWGYWERNKDHVPGTPESISSKDKNQRIDDQRIINAAKP